MDGLYLRVLNNSSKESALLRKNFDKFLTSESIQFFKDHGIICKKLPLPELGGGFEIPFLFKLIGPLIALFNLLTKALIFLIKRGTESKPYGNFAINLMYETSNIDILTYNQRLLEVYDYGITLLSFLKYKYPFLNFSITICCGFSKIHHRNIVFLNFNKQSEFNINRVKFLISRIKLITNNERIISIHYFLIKEITSNIEYIDGGGIMGSGKSKTKYSLM